MLLSEHNKHTGLFLPTCSAPQFANVSCNHHNSASPSLTELFFLTPIALLTPLPLPPHTPPPKKNPTPTHFCFPTSTGFTRGSHSRTRGMSRARCRLHAWAGKFLGQFPEAVIILSLPSTVPLPGPQPPAPCCYGKGCVLPGRYPPPAVAMATVSLPSLPSVATETVARSPFHPPPPPPVLPWRWGRTILRGGCCCGCHGNSFLSVAMATAPLLTLLPRCYGNSILPTPSYPPPPKK